MKQYVIQNYPSSNFVLHHLIANVFVCIYIYVYIYRYFLCTKEKRIWPLSIISQIHYTDQFDQWAWFDIRCWMERLGRWPLIQRVSWWKRVVFVFLELEIWFNRFCRMFIILDILFIHVQRRCIMTWGSTIGGVRWSGILQSLCLGAWTNSK